MPPIRQLPRPPGVPLPVDDGDDTVPVDVEDMRLAARRSVLVVDPDEPPRILRRQATSPPPGLAEPVAYAEIRVAGSRAPVTLRARHLSSTGATFEVPDGIRVEACEGAAATVQLHVPDGPGDWVHARLLARVVFRRNGRNGLAGGLSVRWETSQPGAARDVQLVLARIADGSAAG